MTQQIPAEKVGYPIDRAAPAAAKHQQKGWFTLLQRCIRPFRALAQWHSNESHWQVSWLTPSLALLPPSRIQQWCLAATRCSQLRGQPRNLTAFPCFIRTTRKGSWLERNAVQIIQNQSVSVNHLIESIDSREYPVSDCSKRAQIRRLSSRAKLGHALISSNVRRHPLHTASPCAVEHTAMHGESGWAAAHCRHCAISCGATVCMGQVRRRKASICPQISTHAATAPG